ncbi:MAG: PilZ domain-containing protein [Candidatus Omnitrophota bacterium]
MEERRRFVRLNTLVKVEYAIIEKAGDGLGSTTKNISMGGICLFLDKMIDKGTVLGLKIYIKEEVLPIQARGRVVWIEKFDMGEGDKASHLEAGIEFSQISDADRQRLSKYIFRSLAEIQGR